LKFRQLHDWNLDLKGARSLQEKLRKELIFGKIKENLRYLAGVDVAWSSKTSLLCSAVVIMEFPSLSIIEISSAISPERFPYIPGYLSFREGPVILEAFSKIETVPDIVIFEGQGIAHPRGIGIASHMGLFLDLPSVGCAKTRLTGEYDDPGNRRGDYSPLFLNGMKVGAVLRTKEMVKPIFVSPGYKIELEDAIPIILMATPRYRIPEPIREAHLIACRIRNEIERNS
jgi:deoxyribonuclease V